jgi:hypothetical protein
MSIYKINNNLPTTTKIELLSDMILELKGLINKANFNKNELDQIFADLGSGTIVRKFLRDIYLGNTLSTYDNWSSLKTETGYSIWKYTPSHYVYNILNKLYLDDKSLENRGSANSESISIFDKVFLYDGSYNDNTSEAGSESGTSFSLMATPANILYLGSSNKFNGVSFEFDTRGSNYTLLVEYYNGSVWTPIDISGTIYGDDTNNFISDGRIHWEEPVNWELTSVNSESYYWVRITTTTTPITVATAYLVAVTESVITLLSLSSSEILNEEWAWCSYNGSIYVTIRNAGQPAYEGDYFITSSSTSINKQNYFIHNHTFTADYEDTSY